MHIPIVTVTLHDGSKIEVIRDMEAVRKLEDELKTLMQIFMLECRKLNQLRCAVCFFIWRNQDTPFASMANLKELSDAIDWYPPNNPT